MRMLPSSPYRLSDCPGERVPPLVLASPHSGRHYPPEFLAQVSCSEHALRRAEDAWVDRLFARAAATFSLPFLQGKFARTYVDLNRAPDELDPNLIEGLAASRTNDRLRAGLGVVPRVATPGVPLYNGTLRLTEVRRRIEEVHAPYHQELARLLERARRANGFAILLDCHSMPPLPRNARMASAEVVLGDRYGQSCSDLFRAALREEMERYFRVAENRPYAGGHGTQSHGAPEKGVHAIQIEIDRSLYMDLETLLPCERFAETEKALHAVVGAFAGAVNIGSAPPLAAE